MPIPSPLYILIVEPDSGAANVTRAIVARAAPEATLVVEPSAEGACRNLARHRPDVLIIDPSPSPVMGAQVIASAKARAVQVIVLASAPTAGLRRRMRDLGVDLYLEKPAPLPVAQLRALLEDKRPAS